MGCLVVSWVSGGWAGSHPIAGTNTEDTAQPMQVARAASRYAVPSPQVRPLPIPHIREGSQNDSPHAFQPRRPIRVGDVITQDNIAAAKAFLTPSTWWMIERGMPMRIAAPRKVTWPRAYQDATYLLARLRLAAVYSEAGQTGQARTQRMQWQELSRDGSLSGARQTLPFTEAQDLERMLAALRGAGLR